MVIGADPNGALLGGDRRVVRSGLDRLAEGDGDSIGLWDVDGVVDGIDRGDGQRGSGCCWNWRCGRRWYSG
jgi:hypothetical protein